MKKIIFTFIDTFLLFVVTIYSFFKNMKVDKGDWKQESLNKTIVLGNGPSLKIDMDMVIEKSLTAEVYVLNYFAATKYFNKIKPEYYVLTDRMFWDQNANTDIKKDNEQLFLSLERVEWKMNLICPEAGFNHINKRLIKNKNIKVLKVNSVNIEFKTEKIRRLVVN